ncbi:MAG: hypothetical protein PHD56_05665 [Anaerostipes sp.]|nr:hypothetical protein [Anaerostipes sp.]
MSKEKKRLVIVGAGGFGREVQWLIERINELKDEYEILGYVDDNIKQGIMINNYPVLGGMGYLLEQHDEIGVAVAIGSASVRKKIVKACKKNAKLSFPNLIDPSVIMSNHISMGEGNIICAANVLTVNIEIKDFNIINSNFAHRF